MKGCLTYIKYSKSKMSTNPETIRKRNSKNKETPEERRSRLDRENERKRQKRASETIEKREERLRNTRERQKQRRTTETQEDRQNRLNRDNNRKSKIRKERTEINDETILRNQINQTANRNNVQPNERTHSACNISIEEQRTLQKFRNKIDNIENGVCPMCNERIPGMKFTNEICKRCNSDKSTPKRFSEENNMDPGKLPKEIEGLTEIEEMLIAQVFTVMTVYRLKGGQKSYRGNVINFPQDISEFTTRLPRDPSTLNVLLIRRQSANNPSEF